MYLLNLIASYTNSNPPSKPRKCAFAEKKLGKILILNSDSYALKSLAVRRSNTTTILFSASSDLTSDGTDTDYKLMIIRGEDWN